MPSNVADVVAEYDRLLEGGLAEPSHQHLVTEIAARGLFFDGRPICGVLRPIFVTEETYSAVQLATTLVMDGMLRIAARLRTDEHLRARLRMSHGGELLSQLEPVVSPPVKGRIDGFMTEQGEIRFIEYNPAPFGMSFSDQIGAVFESMPAMQKLKERYALRRPSSVAAGLEAIQLAHERAGGTGKPRLGVLVNQETKKTSKVAMESLAIAETIRAHGISVVEGGGDEDVEIRDGNVFIKGSPVDSIEVSMQWSALPRSATATLEDSEIVRAVATGATRIMNGIANAMFLSSKATFALVSDPANHEGFPPAVTAAIDRHVPWTRMYEAGTTTYAGETIDLLPFVAARRESLVLKPSSGFGGEGVVLGWEVDDATWAAATTKALARPHVVQERVSVPHERFPAWSEGRVEYRDLQYDFDPYVWNGERAEGCLVRVCASGLLNLTAGAASMVPLFVVA